MIDKGNGIREVDAKLLKAIRYDIENKEHSKITPRTVRMPDKKIPKWQIELLEYIQLWNGSHRNDMIEIDPENIDDKKLLARIKTLEAKFT